MNLLEALDNFNTDNHVSLKLFRTFYMVLSGAKVSVSLNGLTDENTIVYWFQSRSFTIDLRLKSQKHTPSTDRQGWIGNTLWDAIQAAVVLGGSMTTPITRIMCNGLSLQSCMRLATVF